MSRPEDRLWDFYAGIHKNRQDIFNHTGIWPEQFPCYVGLTGDSVDCIPGVPGIGPVAARILLQHYADLDSVFAQIDQVPLLAMRGAARCADLLQKHQPLAMLSRKLATIVQHVPECESFAAINMQDLMPRLPLVTAFESLLHDMDIPPTHLQRFLAQLESISAKRASLSL